jgi:hypothetical protein
MARQEVTIFFQKLKMPEPVFASTQIDGQFQCTLTWQGIKSSKGALAAQIFVGKSMSTQLGDASL